MFLVLLVCCTRVGGGWQLVELVGVFCVGFSVVVCVGGWCLRVVGVGCVLLAIWVRYGAGGVCEVVVSLRDILVVGCVWGCCVATGGGSLSVWLLRASCGLVAMVGFGIVKGYLFRRVVAGGVVVSLLCLFLNLADGFAVRFHIGFLLVVLGVGGWYVVGGVCTRGVAVWVVVGGRLWWA